MHFTVNIIDNQLEFHMSKRNELHNQEPDHNSLELEETDNLQIEDTDVGFLIDKDGNLKTVFGPESGFTNPNDTVAAILEILGIDELTAPNRTLH
jgi:phosphoglucomutase